MTRRRQGTGTIERRVQRDGSIRFMPRLPDERRTPLGTYHTYHEAVSLLEAALFELRAGALRTSLTLDAFGQKVIEQRELDGYRAAADDRRRWKYVTGSPSLDRPRWKCADWPIDAIKRKDVVEWTRELKALDLSRATRINALTILRYVFSVAVDEELIESNPAADVKIKDHGRTEETMRPLTLAQLNALFWAASDEGRKLIAAAVGTGLRAGELAALRVNDVYLNDPRPHLMVRLGKPNKPPKNGKIRRVPLFGLGLEAFKAWPIIRNDHGLYFPTPRGGRRRSGKMLERRDWLAWLDKAGIDRRVRWHDLRHTSATLLLLGELEPNAWTLEELCDFLGHSSISVTERYAKFLNMKAERAAQRSHTEATQANGMLKNRAFSERDTGFEPVTDGNLFAALDAVRGLVVALLKRAAHQGDVSRRVVELAAQLLDEIDSDQRAGRLSSR